MAKHAKLSPSKADQWVNCPASIQLCENLPTIPPNAYMQEGTKAHNFAEELLKEKITLDDVPEEFQEALNVYLSFITTLKNTFKNSELYIEQKVELPNTEIFGTCDCLIKSENQIFVIDYKHGAGVSVNVEDNKQLLIYALGALAFFNEYEDKKDIENIVLAIVQPRIKDETPKIKTINYSHNALMTFKEMLQEAVVKTKQKNPDILPGKHCKFCNAKAICPKYYDQVVEVAKTDFKDIKAKLPDIKTLSNQDIIKVLSHSDSIKNWVTAVQNHAKLLLEHGGSLEGYKLVHKRTNRKWINEKEVISTFSAPKYKKLIFEKPKLKSVAQMSKVIPDDKLKKLHHTPRGDLIIVSESDKRPAASSSALIDFKDIEI